MAHDSLENRLAALEGEVLLLKQKVEKENGPWWKNWAGAFLNDPYFEKAVKLGRQYRDSLRPKSKKKRKPANGSA